MPSRNIIKPNTPQSYYHIYARGASKRLIFGDRSDYEFFLSLFERHLSLKQHFSRLSSYPHLRSMIEIISYCLMPNHIHVLVYQDKEGSMERLMRSIMTSYSGYFNRKYKQTGSLFESRYKASLIDNDTYLMHISRYIHLNPRYYKRYLYSSYRYFVKGGDPEWLQKDRALTLFSSPHHYEQFVSDYESTKELMDQIKKDLNES